MDDSELFEINPNGEPFLTAVNHFSKVKSTKISQQTERLIQERLQIQAKHLIQKKEREQQKQTKLKQLEEEFQRERIKKSKEIQQKSAASEKLKAKTIQGIQQKLHKLTKRHQTVISKIQGDSLRQLQKLIDQRKAYDFDSMPLSSKNVAHNSQHSSEKKIIERISKTQSHQGDDVVKKMNEINFRLTKAKSLNKQKQQMLRSKMRFHNISEVQSVRSRANKNDDELMLVHSHRIMSKMQGADHNRQKIQQEIEKKQNDRQKIYSEKLRKIQQNLQHIQDQQNDKFDELNKKYQQTKGGNKAWRDQKREIYLKKFVQNLQHLQKQKINRADQIIEKHQQIAIKNKIYKQRKEVMYRSIKHDPF